MDAFFDRFDVLAAPGQGSTARPLQPQAPSQPRQPGGAGAGGAAGRGAGTGSRPPSNVKQGDGISSLCGLPAITIPCGFSKDRLPIGIQFMGRALEDEKVVAAANLFQSRTDWHKKHRVL